MKKLMVFGALGVVVALAAKRGCAAMFESDWQNRIESMPDNAPPKWMVRNISEIRRNTERIMRLLETEQELPAPPVTAAN
jgi:hypothetical protein